MAEVVGLDGKPVSEEVQDSDTPEAVLERLLSDIREGRYTVKRIVIAVEHDSATRFFTRSSRMMNSEAIALLAVAARLTMDFMLDI